MHSVHSVFIRYIKIESFYHFFDYLNNFEQKKQKFINLRDLYTELKSTMHSAQYALISFLTTKILCRAPCIVD